MPGKITDHLANERTFLAWIRTALGLSGFGFVLGKMGIFLRQLAGPVNADRTRTGHEFVTVGVIFLVFGTLFAAWACGSHEQNRRAIDADTFAPAKWSIYLMTAAVVIGSLVIVVLSIWRMTESG